MKFSTEDCDLFSRKILYPIEQNNTKLKISGMIIAICVLFGFCFLFIVYNFIYSFDKINEKIEKQTNILSFYRKSYDYNDINSSINTTLYKDPYYFIAGKVEEDDSVFYDENMVKAVFYCLQFGFRKDDLIIPDIDIGEFVEYFEDKTMDDLLVILNEIAADYEVYKITGNTGVAVKEIYNYLNE